jgi:hypothetical protein
MSKKEAKLATGGEGKLAENWRKTPGSFFKGDYVRARL